jgi:hypothetical protein
LTTEIEGKRHPESLVSATPMAGLLGSVVTLAEDVHLGGAIRIGLNSVSPLTNIALGLTIGL